MPPSLPPLPLNESQRPPPVAGFFSFPAIAPPSRSLGGSCKASDNLLYSSLAEHHDKETTMAEKQKVGVITGASQGIGAGLVRGFLDRGYKVVANSRSIKPSGDVLAVA